MNSGRYQPTDRRPIPSRDSRWARRLADWLAARNVNPNTISVLGMVGGILAGCCLAGTASYAGGSTDAHGFVRLLWLTGAILTLFRLLANLLDGMVAIRRDIASAIGELFNEIPDRISYTAILIGLGLADGGNQTLGMTAAIVALLTAYVRTAVKVAGAPQNYCGPMAKPHRMSVVIVVALVMGLSPEGWLPTIGEQGEKGSTDIGLASLALIIIVVGGLITSWRRLRTGVEFLRQNRERDGVVS